MMRSKRRGTWILAAASAALLSMGVATCGQFGVGSIFMWWQTPLLAQLSLAGDLPVDLRTSPLVDPDELTIELDGVPVPLASLNPTPDGFDGVLPGVGVGKHTLIASTTIDLLLIQIPLVALTIFHVVDLDNADECDVVNNVRCLLPYPSSRFLEDVGAETATGFRLAVPVSGVPQPDLPGIDEIPLSPDPINQFDGFSPTVQILMHFPQTVDLAASDAPVLLDPFCCGQSQATPYVDVRTQNGRSVESDSPTVLLDADTGERVLHWVELDARADEPGEDQAMFLRPGKALVPGHRYIVAVRNLVDTNGDKVKPEAAFRTLRNGTPSTIPAVEARRDHYDDIFSTLWQQAGISRWKLTLAFDFVVRSQEQLTSDMLIMRDDAMAYLAGIAPGDLSGVTMNAAFNAANVFDCSDPGQFLWRHVKGTFDGPFYMTGSILPVIGAPFINRDADGVPERNTLIDEPFNIDIGIPCSVFNEDEVGLPLLLGHGLFGTGASMVNGFGAGVFGAIETPFIAGATDWRGLSSLDSLWLLLNVIGTGATGHRLNNFPAFTGRLQQGQVNALVLTRLMKSGYFNRFPEFQRTLGDPSTGVFTPDPPELNYLGVSLGGIMGIMNAALSEDISRYNIDVGAINFSLLLQRSTQFDSFEVLLGLSGLDVNDRPLDAALGLGLLHEQWVSAEPAAYARHVTGNTDPPLAGSFPKKILMTNAWLDKQVSNQATEIAARTLGIPSLEGSLLAGLEEIPDVAAGVEGLDSALVFYDTGSFDVFDPAFDPFIPALANLIPSSACDPHGRRQTIPASLDQLETFLQPGGKIFNFCDGACDSAIDYERTDGLPQADICDPLAP